MNATARIQTALTFLSAAKQADPDPETAAVYLTALSDLDLSALERACRQLALEPRRAFEPALPTVGKIREVAQTILEADRALDAAAKLLPAPITDEEGQRYACLDCLDTSWQIFDCAGKGKQASLEHIPQFIRHPCARPKAHPRHTYAERCACFERNPVIAERRRQVESRQQRGNRGTA